MHIVDICSNFQFFLSFSQSSILSIAFLRMSSLLIHVLSLFEMGVHPYDVRDRFLNNDCLCLHLHGPLFYQGPKGYLSFFEIDEGTMLAQLIHPKDHIKVLHTQNNQGCYKLSLCNYHTTTSNSMGSNQVFICWCRHSKGEL